MRFIETVFEKLRRHPKRIIFPEGTEPRVLAAASRFAKDKLGAPILLGKREAIAAAASAASVSLDHVGIIDPETSDDLPRFVSFLEGLRRYRDLGTEQSRALLVQPNYFGAMMVQHGLADTLVTGASEAPASTLRPLIRVIKPMPGMDRVSSCTMLDLATNRYGERGVIFFADCAVIPEPTIEDLAQIAVETGHVCRQLTGEKPRIAFLSFSTKGSSTLPSAAKMAAAAALAKKKIEDARLDFEVDGELQADVALSPELGARKQHGSLVVGKANVLIFPDLNAGNIAVKLVQHLGGADAYGKLLLGLTRPCVDLSRGATEDDILGCAAIAGLRAIEFRKLYPEL